MMGFNFVLNLFINFISISDSNMGTNFDSSFAIDQLILRLSSNFKSITLFPNKMQEMFLEVGMSRV